MPLSAITVSQLNNYIRQVFEAEELLHNVTVVGDIDGISIRGNAVYFSLRDEGATIPCVCYIPSKLKGIENGTNVQVRGTVGYWHKAGKINFTVNHIEAFGLGKLFIEFQKLQEKLAKEGMFDVGRKKAIPTDPRRIGVVTSRSGAVIHDIIRVAHRRNPSVGIVLYPVTVQGIGAEGAIADGIEFFNAVAKGEYLIDPVDIIMVARGGGSKEDLAPFSSESVARAAFSSSIPIVSAVGHETDWSLLDLVADLRAPTPSAGAEIIVPTSLTRKEKAIQSWRLIKYMTGQKLSAVQSTIQMTWGDIRSGTENAHKNAIQATISRWSVIRTTTTHRVDRAEARGRELAIYVEEANPLAILRKGYGRVFSGKDDVTEVGQVSIGDVVLIKMYNGEIEARVEEVK
ncbi:MAG: exodeoxyribonuclease VII large subunit [Firmicutes bacterium]|nr:exodeoxyribonuclease VII large subunit [Bacillota bacterium]